MKKIQQKILCVGSTGKDIFFPVSAGTVIETNDRINSEKQFCFGYGKKVHVENRYVALGGCACNVSVGLARLGLIVSALGNVGDDPEGKWITTTLAQDGVDIQNARVIKGVNTDLSVIIVDANTGERTIFVNRDVGERLTINGDDTQGFNWCFVGSLYGNDIRNNMEVMHDALLEKNIKLVYNPGSNNITYNEDIVMNLLHNASVVFVNKSEAQEIVSKFNLPYNEDDLLHERYLLKAIKEHMHDSSGVVVLTDGLRGAWCYDGDHIYHTNTIDKPVHDATGAGDAFASGFFAGILYKLSLERCMQWGSANSDSVIDHYGAQEGLCTYDMIQERISLFPVENKK